MRKDIFKNMLKIKSMKNLAKAENNKVILKREKSGDLHFPKHILII